MVAAGSGGLPLPVGERAGVRGDRSQVVGDALENAVDVLKHLVVPESKYEIPARFQSASALAILLAALTVLSAIRFDDQARGFAAKIHDVAIDRHLPTEFQSAQTPIPQPEPKHALGIHLDLFQRIMIAPCSVTAIGYHRHGPVVLTVNSVDGDLGWLGGK